MATYYALRNNAGLYMTCPASGKSATATDPRPLDQEPPRLFRLKHHAHDCLRWWLQGRHFEVWSQDWEGEMDVDLRNVVVPERLKAEWEVVTVEVTPAVPVAV